MLTTRAGRRGALAAAASLLTLGVALQAQAQEAATSASDEVVVTAERFGSGLARATFTIGAEDIQERPLGAEITQALVKVPGVQVSTGDSRGGSFSFEIYMRGLSDELNRRWNPNCAVEGGQDVNVKVTLRLGPGGRLIGQPTSNAANSPDPIVKAASDRAIRAVIEAAPFDTLPTELFGQTYSVNFDARKACAA